jgi:hypothetical protein
MAVNLLFYDLLLVILLWLGGLLYKKWVRSRSAPCPTTRQTATPLHQHARDPKPFPGLTHNPHCAACEHATEPGSPAPRVPLRGVPPQRDGRGRWIPLSSSVLIPPVSIGVGRGGGIFGPMAIPTGVAGGSSSVSAASSTF